MMAKARTVDCHVQSVRNQHGLAGGNRAYFYAVWDPVLLGVRDGNLKYVWEPGAGEWLYDLPSDPQELSDLSLAQPAKAQSLRSMSRALVAFQQQWLDENEADR